MPLTFPPEFHPLKQQVNQAVLDIARTQGCQAFLVGGYVRDALLQRFSDHQPPSDFDYMVMNASAIEFARAVHEKLDGHFVLLDQANDTARLVFDNGSQLDFAGCVGGTIDSDMRRRDLSINALAWDAGTDQIIDVVGGMADLESGTIRATSEQNMIDDPLRILRAYRFAAMLGFQIEASTLLHIKNHAKKLNESAGERINYELFAILKTSRAGETFRGMSRSGVLEVVFPEMTLQHQVPPNAYHHLPLFEHSLEVMAQSEIGFPALPPWARETFKSELSHRCDRLAATKLAALLHDIGKPATYILAPDGRPTFIGHDKLGAEMCDPIAQRLKWSRPVERFISSLIRWHLRPGSLFHQGLPTEKAVHRFYRAIGDEVPQLVLLAQADFRATCGPGLKEGRELLENQLRELLDGYAVFREGRKTTPRLLDGADVMKLLGIQPGPVVGELLSDLEEAQGLREVKDRQQAEVFVLEQYKQKYSR